MGLGEMMSFPNVIGAEDNIHAELAETLKSDNIITGHFSIPDTGAALNAYIASGIRCCHESTRAEDVLEKMRHGMYALMRYGSAWHDMPVIIKAVLDNRIDDRFACLISDDTHPDTLINEGHLDHIVRCAVKEGLDPIKAIQYVTINVATCFRMDHEMGSITPGKCADIVFFDDLQDIRITRTMIDGDVVAEKRADVRGDRARQLPGARLPHDARRPPDHGRELPHRRTGRGRQDGQNPRDRDHPEPRGQLRAAARPAGQGRLCRAGRRAGRHEDGRLRAPPRDGHEGRRLPQGLRLQEGRDGADRLTTRTICWSRARTTRIWRWRPTRWSNAAAACARSRTARCWRWCRCPSRA